MIWFTSDTHWGHSAVIGFCKRPFTSVEEMNEALIENWNKKVQPNDVVYVLGDMAMCSFKEFEPIAKRLNGNKILVQGNHDKYSGTQYNRLGFTVYQELTIKLAGNKVRLSHYPYALPWYRRLFAHKSELRYMECRPSKVPGEFLLHGHSHVKYKLADHEDRIHIGADAWDYSPVSQKEIESLIARRKDGKI